VSSGSGPRQGSVTLRDGRLLSYAEWGNPTAPTLLHFHGTPGSRLERHPDPSVYASREVRFVTVDRPGYGRSSPKPGRTVLEWVDDVEDLADALGADRFAVEGFSGGGVYALACGLRIPERLTAVGLLSGLAPFDRPGAFSGLARLDRSMYTLARRAPPLARAFAWYAFRQIRRRPDVALRRFAAELSEPDRKVVDRPAVRRVFVDSLTEAAAAGIRGYVQELALLSRPWGFQPADVEIDVHMWQGEQDTLAPLGHGRYLAESIPHVHPRFCPGEGHLLSVDHAEEIFETLGFPTIRP